MYERSCPQCAVVINYKCEISYIRACKKTISCSSCRCKAAAHKRPPISIATKQKMSEARMGSKNSFFGRKHTVQTRQLISDNHAECAGEKNGFYGEKHDLETRRLMSAKRAAGIANGNIPNTNGFGRKGWYQSSKSSDRFYYDSALEKFRMELLDADPNVITWTKRHGIKIPYISLNFKQRLYVPDFKIERIDGVFLEEVKGYDVERENKQAALLRYCREHQLQMSWISQAELETQGYRQWLSRQ